MSFPTSPELKDIGERVRVAIRESRQLGSRREPKPSLKAMLDAAQAHAVEIVEAIAALGDRHDVAMAFALQLCLAAVMQREQLIEERDALRYRLSGN